MISQSFFECRLCILRGCPVGVQWALTSSSAHGFYSSNLSPCPESGVDPAPLKRTPPPQPGFRTGDAGFRGQTDRHGSKCYVLAFSPLSFGHAAERQRSVRWRLRSGFHARAPHWSRTAFVAPRQTGATLAALAARWRRAGNVMAYILHLIRSRRSGYRTELRQSFPILK